MNPYERRPGIGGIFQRNAWLLPLLLGVGIGAFLFGLPSFDWGRDNRRGYDRHITQAPQLQNDNAQQVAPVVPDREDARERHMDHGFGHERFAGRHDGGFGFFPFGLSRLIVPALLISAGLWFLRGSRGGPGWGGLGHPSSPSGQANSPYTMPVAPPEAPAPGTTEPPSTSETRRL